MANEIQKLYNLPEISFIEGITYEGILNEMVPDFETKYTEETGRKIKLRPGDKEHIHLRVLAGQYYQMYQQLDYAAKMNLLKYSKGDFLKHLGAFKALGGFQENIHPGAAGGGRESPLYAFGSPERCYIHTGRNTGNSRGRRIFCNG